jgi:hypothetical protein
MDRDVPRDGPAALAAEREGDARAGLRGLPASPPNGAGCAAGAATDGYVRPSRDPLQAEPRVVDLPVPQSRIW